MAPAHEPRLARVAAIVADPARSRMLESPALVAERQTHEKAWTHPQRARLRQARCCYGYLAGVLAVHLFEAMLARSYLADDTNGYRLTPEGSAWLRDMGLTPRPPNGRRRYAYRCLDWSERRDHLAGQLADDLLAHVLAMGWLRRDGGRALTLTAAGRCEWLPRLGFSL